VGLRVEDEQVVWITARRVYPLPTVFLALLVAAVSYLAARLGGTLVLPPQAVSALWPGCALLVAVLLLVPRRTWPALIPAGLAGFVLHDLQVGFQPLTIALFILGDAIEIIIVVLGLRYSFDGIPRLNSLKALAKYSFFAVLLGPFIGGPCFVLK
jgi:integral membrane sensor domain MASE1